MIWTDNIITKIELKDTVIKWIDELINKSVTELNQAFRDRKLVGYEAKKVKIKLK